MVFNLTLILFKIVEEVRELERVQYVQLEVDGNEKAVS